LFCNMLVCEERREGEGGEGEIDGDGAGLGLEEWDDALAVGGAGPEAVLGGGGGEMGSAADGGDGMEGAEEFGGADEVVGLAAEDGDGGVEVAGVFNEPLLTGVGTFGHEQDARGAGVEAQDQGFVACGAGIQAGGRI